MTMGSKCVFLNSLPHPAPRRALPTMIKTNILCYLFSVLCSLFSVLCTLFPKKRPGGAFFNFLGCLFVFPNHGFL